MRTLAAGVLLFVFSAACNYDARDARKILHGGQRAVLDHNVRTDLPVAPLKDDAHAVARAAESFDEATLHTMVAAGKAVMVPRMTHVIVLSESFNERFIRIAEGPSEGKQGWVPYEWLRRPGDLVPVS